MINKKITVAVIGLSFGKSFAQIYAYHPNVERVVIVDKIKERVSAALMGIRRKNVEVYDTFEDVLNDPSIDAVHICTGILSHADLSVKVLKAGKHCACAVPMATSLEDIKAIVDATRESGKNYMMMETMLYGAHFLKAKEMLEKGEFGKVQHMRGIHYQPMDAGYWNREVTAYWQGLPPMYYATHAIAPLRGIAGARIEKVICVGSGTMSERLTSKYNNPYPIEDALLCFENGLKGEVVRGLFECSAKMTESFNIYGSKRTFMDEYMHAVITKEYDETKYDCAAFITEHMKFPNRYELLPKDIQRFTVLENDTDDEYEELLDTASLVAHHGSHPHLCHEFVSSIVENRKSAIDEDMSANITAAGICAHISALNGGVPQTIPVF